MGTPLRVSSPARRRSAWFFGITQGQDEVLETLGVPAGLRSIGALGFGYKAPGDRMEGSSVTIPRRTFGHFVHRSGWQRD